MTNRVISSVVDPAAYGLLFAVSRAGEKPASPEFLGLVVETHSGERKFSDVLAAYPGGRMLIYPASGRLTTYDAVNPSINKLLAELMTLAASASKDATSTPGPGKALLAPHSFRISYLWSDGIRLGEGLLAAPKDPSTASILSTAESLDRLFGEIPQPQGGNAFLKEMLRTGKPAPTRAQRRRTAVASLVVGVGLVALGIGSAWFMPARAAAESWGMAGFGAVLIAMGITLRLRG